MWKFQRLNSVGEEDSSVKLTFNNLINSTADNTRNPFLFQAKMPPVMSLTCNNNSRAQFSTQPMCTPFSRARSFSEVSKSEPYSERFQHNRVKGPSLSFDSYNKMYKPALLTGSLTHKGRQFSSPCYQDGSVMAAVETLQGSGHGLGITAAVAALGMASSKQKVDLSNSVTTPDSWEDYLLDDTDSVPSLHRNSNSNVPVSGISKHDGGSKEESQDPVPLASSCSGLNVTFSECDTEMNKYSKPAASDCSDLNMPFNESDTEMSKFSVESQSQCECVLQASHDITDLSMNDYISSDVEKCDKDVRSTTDDNPPQTLKPVSNLSFILSEPRKTAKKGRPSSKKQKKRQREKRKHRSHSVVPEKSESSSSDSWLEQRSDEISSSLTSSLSSSHTNRRNFHEKQSTPVKESTKSCPISRLFFSPSYSEEADDEEDGDNERSTKQSMSKQWKSCISPIKEVCFNFALNLDSIFKQKNIPSLKSLGGENDCSSPQTFYAKKSYRQNSSLSDDESFENSSVDLCDQSSSSDGATCGFTIGLSFDTLFTQRPPVGSQAAADATDRTCDFTDSLTSGESSHQVSSEVDLTAVNAKWDENYPTAGNRSCQCTTKDEIKHPDIKVNIYS